MRVEDRLMELDGGLPSRVTEGIALGTGLADGYGIYESPVGAVVVAFNPRGVSAVDLASDGFEERFTRRFGRRLIPAEAPRAWAAHIGRAIEMGTPGKVPVDLRSVTPFRMQVLLEAARIPRGEVRSYGWLASAVDNPGAARAVGSTMATNPVPLIIPCHRVVRADGTLGDYSLGGSHLKLELLRHEGAALRL